MWMARARMWPMPLPMPITRRMMQGARPEVPAAIARRPAQRDHALARRPRLWLTTFGRPLSVRMPTAL